MGVINEGSWRDDTELVHLLGDKNLANFIKVAGTCGEKEAKMQRAPEKATSTGTWMEMDAKIYRKIKFNNSLTCNKSDSIIRCLNKTRKLLSPLI